VDTHAHVPLSSAIDDRTIEREIEEVTGAILLVTDRRQSRVLVCNLAHCAAVVDAVQALADEVGVDIELIARPDGHGCDVAIQGR